MPRHVQVESGLKRRSVHNMCKRDGESVANDTITVHFVDSDIVATGRAGTLLYEVRRELILHASSLFIALNLRFKSHYKNNHLCPRVMISWQCFLCSWHKKMVYKV